MPEPEPKYGERLLNRLLIDGARDDPDRPIYTIPKGIGSYAKGYRVVTAKDFVKAIDRLAWFIEEKLGKTTANDTIAYIGPNDIRYILLILATSKTRYKLLLTSPRNSVSNHLHLLDKTDCSVFFKSRTTNIDHIIRACPNPLHVINIPEVDELLASDDVVEYPYDYKFEQLKGEKVLILHSSGSTGQVKPIFYTNRSLSSFDQHNLLHYKDSDVLMREVPEGNMLTAMPYFHGAAVIIMLSHFWFGTSGALFPAETPITLAKILECLELAPITSLFMPPSIVEEAAQSPKALKALEKLSLLSYGGGSVSEKAADIVSEHVRAQNYIGTTESGLYPIFPHDERKDNIYFKFDPNQSGMEFRHAADDLYELVFVRHEGPQWNCTWETFPDKTEYHTSDLYKPHPTKPGLWKHSGRTDDVIVFSNGEKVSPSKIETFLCFAPEIRSVLLYGSQRFQIAAIIELEAEAQRLTQEEALKRIEPYIKQANQDAPGHAQLSMDKIIFTRLEKPMIRLPKGAIARKATFIAFELELDEVYSRESGFKTSETPLLKGASEEQTIEVLTGLLSQVSETTDLSADQDLFQAGIDSLQVITTVRLLKAQVKEEGAADVPIDAVNTSLVYSNPTIQSLAKALRNLDREVTSEEQKKKHLDEVQALMDKYTANLPAATPGAAKEPNSFSVILTGSTGSLGSYLLDTLLADERITRIFSLNRSSDGRSKQLQSSTARGLSTDWGERVHFLHADLGKPFLGLDQSLYERMVETTTHIIHNQWPVNFNIALSTFEPHIRGVRHLVDLAAAAPHKPSILFTSSIGATLNWPLLHPGESVPEAEITDAWVAGPMGYSASKHIGEHILAAAARESGVGSAIVRVGQMAGSVDKKSVWNRDEWFPSMVISSQHLEALPSDMGSLSSIDFVPMDWGAAILWDFASSEAVAKRGGAHYFNMVNWNRVPYGKLVPTLVKTLKPAPKVVSYQEWVQKLKRANENGDNDTEQNPAIKLLDFFEKGLGAGGDHASEYTNTFATEKAQEASKHMRKLGPVVPEWMEAWIHGWGLGK